MVIENIRFFYTRLYKWILKIKTLDQIISLLRHFVREDKDALVASRFFLLFEEELLLVSSVHLIVEGVISKELTRYLADMVILKCTAPTGKILVIHIVLKSE